MINEPNSIITNIQIGKNLLSPLRQSSKSFNNNNSSNKNDRIYFVNEFDENCEEHSRIKKIVCLKFDTFKITLFVILNILTAGLISLFTVWFPSLQLCFIYKQTSIKEATKILIYGTGIIDIILILDKHMYYEDISTLILPEIQNSHLNKFCFYNITSSEVKLFQFKLFKYIFDETQNCFVCFKFEIRSSYESILSNFRKGLTANEVKYQKLLFGNCDLDIQIASIFRLIINEVTDTFYIFQAFSVILWCIEKYIIYAVIIVILTLISITISVYETKSNLLNIQSMAKYSCKIEVYRNNHVKYIYNLILNLFFFIRSKTLKKYKFKVLN